VLDRAEQHRGPAGLAAGASHPGQHLQAERCAEPVAKIPLEAERRT
jgi:hypothetical protein